MDNGKEKFGGPFTEEEVEDVKTVLRLLPLIICLSFSVCALELIPLMVYLFYDDQRNSLLNDSITNWLFSSITDSTLPALAASIFSQL